MPSFVATVAWQRLGASITRAPSSQDGPYMTVPSLQRACGCSFISSGDLRGTEISPLAMPYSSAHDGVSF